MEDNKLTEFEKLSQNEKNFWITQASELLTGLLVCTRVWEAWSVGTMSEDDFISADEDDDTIESMAVNLYNIHNKKVFDLRQIMPPTCTPNARKFLDEIREKFMASWFEKRRLFIHVR
jgi:hypothetical protein